MSTEITPGIPTTCRYSKQEKDQPVRLVFELREELEHATGYGGVDRRPVGLRHGGNLRLDSPSARTGLGFRLACT